MLGRSVFEYRNFYFYSYCLKYLSGDYIALYFVVLVLLKNTYCKHNNHICKKKKKYAILYVFNY